MGDARDLQRFWSAVDHSAGDKEALVRTLEHQYFQQASAGLQHFIRWTGLTPSRLAQAYHQRPAYHASLRHRELALQTAADTAALSRTLRAAWLDAVPAELQFVLGDFTCGGTVAPGLILLALEFFPPAAVRLAAPAQLPTFAPADLPALLAHELIHVQQLTRCRIEEVERLDLLALTLLEGAAEYLGFRLSGACATPPAHAFGQAHRAEVLAAFAWDLSRPEPGAWFYTDAGPHGWPRDLGYFVGFELCRAYHLAHQGSAEVWPELIFGYLSPERFEPIVQTWK